MNTNYTMALLYPSGDPGGLPVPSLENTPIEKLRQMLETAEKKRSNPNPDIDYEDHIKVLTEEIQRRGK